MSSPSPAGDSGHAPVADPVTRSMRLVIAAALAEDAAGRDVTTLALVPAVAQGAASIRVKSAGVVAGLDVARAVFAAVDPALRFEPTAKDGDRVDPIREIARVQGSLRSLLAGERTAVNFLQRMGGIATLTARFTDAVRGSKAQILATRKTAPALREFDLAAVRCGGGGVHRGSLSERVLVKENHLRAARAAGSCDDMAAVVRRVIEQCGESTRVGIEAADLDELRAALVPGVDVVLLDNFTPARCAEAVRIRNEARDRGGGVEPQLEASGGITLQTVRAFAQTGVERISVGALTHSAAALDVSLTILPGAAPAV